MNKVLFAGRLLAGRRGEGTILVETSALGRLALGRPARRPPIGNNKLCMMDASYPQQICNPDLERLRDANDEVP